MAKEKPKIEIVLCTVMPNGELFAADISDLVKSFTVTTDAPSGKQISEPTKPSS